MRTFRFSPRGYLTTPATAILLMLILTGCASEVLTPIDVSGVTRTTTMDRISHTPAGTYAGWWDEEPLPDQPKNLVFYSTATGKVIQTIGSPTPLNAKNEDFLRSPKWAKNVILVMDPATNTIADSFAVDASGNPTDMPVNPVTTGGYEGWWNSTPIGGDAAGLPVETVQVNTDTNQVIDGYNRTTKSTHVDYTVVPDDSWPKDSVVIIDTSTNKVIDNFPIADDGTPIH